MQSVQIISCAHAQRVRRCPLTGISPIFGRPDQIENYPRPVMPWPFRRSVAGDAPNRRSSQPTHDTPTINDVQRHWPGVQRPDHTSLSDKIPLDHYPLWPFMVAGRNFHQRPLVVASPVPSPTLPAALGRRAVPLKPVHPEGIQPWVNHRRLPTGQEDGSQIASGRHKLRQRLPTH